MNLRTRPMLVSLLASILVLASCWASIALATNGGGGGSKSGGNGGSKSGNNGGSKSGGGHDNDYGHGNDNGHDDDYGHNHGGSSPPPSTPPTSGPAKIVYEKYADSLTDGSLFTLTEGAAPSNLHSWGQYPALDPSGGLIAYLDYPNVEIADADGTNPVSVLDVSGFCCDVHPQWLPDGKGIMVDVGGDIVRLTQASNWTPQTVIGWPGNQTNPVVSPDGTKISFLSSTNSAGVELDPEHGGERAVFVANANGSSPVQLTDPIGTSGPAFDPYFGGPSFSTDGKTILIDAFSAANNYADAEIYGIDIATRSIRDVSNLPGDDTVPDVLPDGRVLFVHYDPAFSRSDLMTMKADGSSPKALGDGADLNAGEWLPDASGRQPTAVSAPDTPGEVDQVHHSCSNASHGGSSSGSAHQSPQRYQQRSERSMPHHSGSFH